jgi:adenylosuccinate lyase
MTTTTECRELCGLFPDNFLLRLDEKRGRLRSHHRTHQTRARRAADHGDRATGPLEIEGIAVPEIFSLAAGALTQTRFMVSGLQIDERRCGRILTSPAG